MGGAGGWADAAAGGSARQRSGERVGDARAAARTLAAHSRVGLPIRARPLASPRIGAKKDLEPSLRKYSFLDILLGRLFASVTSANVAQLVEQRTRNA